MKHTEWYTLDALMPNTRTRDCALTRYEIELHVQDGIGDQAKRGVANFDKLLARLVRLGYIRLRDETYEITAKGVYAWRRNG